MLAAQTKPLALQQQRRAQRAPAAARRPAVRTRAQPQAVEAEASSATRPLRVMISGAPASGKGTQAARIVDKVSRRD
jgi:pantothenate kinase